MDFKASDLLPMLPPVLVALLSLVEVSPIKINPWSGLAKWLGRAINGISTHALREEGDPNWLPCWTAAAISTHALREEGDCSTQQMPSSPPKFLPTPSARRATSIPPTSWPSGLSISTHALREEGDHDGRVAAIEHDGFLPTPSARRATPSARSTGGTEHEFLPTPSARRATFMAL